MAEKNEESMKLRVSAPGGHYQVEIKDGGTIIVNRRPYYVDLNGNSLLVNNRSYEISSFKEENGGPALISINQEIYQLEIEEMQKHATRRKAARRGGIREGEIVSPLSGQIVSVETGEGAKVGKNEVIFILEAMKMESEIFSPKEGRIKEIRVAKGDMVNSGDILAIIE
jgi:biotin carboxyl carrier protein